jgi:D-beta-D-heptose 7-phosphate kinase/D-beta-D-heptose 1-phosphate adenosyltransferase
MPLPSADPSGVIGRFGACRILVVGDVMLDQFVIGRVERISPEAPVPVVEFDHEEYRLGGAANVAHNIVSLGGTAAMAGVVGADEQAGTLRGDLAALGIDHEGLLTDPGRKTTRKLRIVTSRNQQVARVDYEATHELAPDVERALSAAIDREAARAHVVLLSDYLKGAITRAIVKASAAAARRHGIPLLVDPKVPHIDYYAGASLVTPNHHEAEAVTLMRVRSAEEAGAAAAAFKARAQCESVLITRGEHGMFLLDAAGAGHDIPAASREVSDVTGAGDTVIATMALALAAGATLSEAARLANVAAGIVVGKFGPAAVTAEELAAAVAAR